MKIPKYFLCPLVRRPPLQNLASVITLLLSLTCTVQAADTRPSYSKIVVDDVQYILTSPSRWQTHEWRNVALSAVGVAGVAAIVDRPLRDEMRRQVPGNRFLLHVERFGAEYSLGVLGGFYLAGAWVNDEKASTVAQDGLAACFIASSIITPTIKFITGRGRPRENVGIANFRPLSGGYSLNSSFPSGHTTQAFTLASVIAAHYEEAWVAYTSYTVASLVGIARSYHDAHFASDVLAGALIGSWVGHSVVEHNRVVRPGKVVMLPEITPELTGVRLVRSF